MQPRAWRMRIFAAAALLWFGAAEFRRLEAQSPPPAFDVASIKPGDHERPGPWFHIGPDSFTTQDTLKHLILFAYDIEDYQLSGGPEWAQTDLYAVQAKAAAAVPPRQLRAMLQQLLALRFHLELSRETRTMAGYVLVPDRNGPKLPPPRTDVPADSTGVVELGGGEIWGHAVTMRHLAHGLRLEVDRPVLDQTQIEGHYDFKLRFDEQNPELLDRTPGAENSGAAGSVFTALREIGLRLEARKLPIEVLVIGSAQRPSEN